MVAKLTKRKAKWLISFGENNGRVLVHSGESVKVGSELVHIDEVESDYIDFGQAAKTWSTTLKDSIRAKLRGARVNAGQEIIKGVKAIRDGVVAEIDEFMMARIESEIHKERVLRSPVKAVVGDIDKDSLSLKFEAFEVPLQGVVAGKVWGEGIFKLVSALSDITNQSKGTIIFMSNFNRSSLIKAEVLEAAGAVIMDEGKELNTISLKMPIALIDPRLFQEIKEQFGETQSYRMLLNSKSDRLLVVVQ